MYQWNFNVLVQYWKVFADGLVTTILLSGEVLATSLVLSIVLALLRISPVALFRALAACFVELFRNVPPLILLIWIYYCIPALSGWQASAHLAAFFALTLYASAFTSEIIRAGLQSVSVGQWEAGRSIGLSSRRIFRYVILPQAIKRMSPALINQSIEIAKTTTLASTIAFGELLYNARLISDVELRPLEAYTTACAIFIVAFSLWSGLLSRFTGGTKKEGKTNGNS